MPWFVKKKLDVNNTLIRKEWLKRGYVLSNDEKRDAETVWHYGKTYRALKINNEILKELNYYFGENESVIPFYNHKS